MAKIDEKGLCVTTSLPLGESQEPCRRSCPSVLCSELRVFVISRSSKLLEHSLTSPPNPSPYPPPPQTHSRLLPYSLFSFVLLLGLGRSWYQSIGNPGCTVQVLCFYLFMYLFTIITYYFWHPCGIF